LIYFKEIPNLFDPKITPIGVKRMEHFLNAWQ
jgi:hypothetical protein